MLSAEKRKALYFKLLDALIYIDKIALEDSVEEVKYCFEDYYSYFQIEKNLCASKIKLMEDLEISNKFEVIVQPDQSSYKKKYTDLFNSVMANFYETEILPALKLTTSNLKNLYVVGGDLVIATESGFIPLFSTDGGDELPNAIYTIAYVLNQNNKYVENATSLTAYSTRTDFSNVVLNKDSKIVLYYHKVIDEVGDILRGYSPLRTKNSGMLIVNNAVPFTLLNKLVEGADYNHLDKLTSKIVKCKATGKEIVISTLFGKPDNVIEVDGDFFYRDAYKAWAMSNKYKCEIKTYEGTTIYKFNDETIPNLQKMSRFDSSFLRSFTKVNNYTYKPFRYVHVNEGGKSGFIRDALYMGVELEVDGGGENHDNAHLFQAAVTNYRPYLYASHDASLNRGFETKTFPSTLEALSDKKVFNWDLGFRVLKDRGYLSGDTETCGLHIHLSKKFFTTPLDKFELSDDELDKLGLTLLSIVIENNWKDVVKFTRRSQERLDRWAPNRRVLDSYRTKLLNERTPISEFYSIIDRVYQVYRDHSNAVNNSKTNTFELRIFRGTINPTVFLATMQFAHNLSHLVRDLMRDIVIHISEESSLHTAKAFENVLKVKFDDIINYRRFEELDAYVSDYSKFRD